MGYINIMAFYIKDLSIHGFCYPWDVLEPISCEYWGMTAMSIFLMRGKLNIAKGKFSLLLKNLLCIALSIVLKLLFLILYIIVTCRIFKDG